MRRKNHLHFSQHLSTLVLLQYNYHQILPFRLLHIACLGLGKGKGDQLALALPPYVQSAWIYSGAKFLPFFELLEIAWTLVSAYAVDGGSGASRLPALSSSHVQGHTKCQI